MQGITSPIKSRVYAQETIPSFIRKTYDILEEAKFPDIIDWNPEGTALVIKKAAEFCQKVLPTYFKHSNLTSFVRQLNMYNFHKKRTQNLDHVYYHELFQRGKKYLLSSIRRKTQNDPSSGLRTPKTSEENAQTQDFNTLVVENQYLKKLYNDTMAKLNHLEREVHSLQGENQSLISQLSQNSLPNAQNWMIMQDKNSADYSSMKNQSDHALSSVKMNGFAANFNCTDDSNASTELSYSSPSVQFSMESDRVQDFSEPTKYSSMTINETLQSPFISMTSMKHTPIFSKPVDDFKTPNQELQFSQQQTLFPHETQLLDGAQKCSNNNQGTTMIPRSVLGKRQSEMSTEFQAYEPFPKRYGQSMNDEKIGDNFMKKQMIYLEEGSTYFDSRDLPNHHFHWSISN